jgi:hypothetical protein
MLKYAVASVVLLVGVAASSPAALAAPRNDDCVGCTPLKPYDSESPARIRQEMDPPRAPDTDVAPPAESVAPPQRSTETPSRDCADCPPPKRYDSTEVIKNSRDVDQSRVINTKSEVIVPPRTREINKLIVHENETRNVGVIQHNHQIIEKEIRYVRRQPIQQRYVAPQVVVPQYRVQQVLVPVQQSSGCGCGGSTVSYGIGYIYTPEYVRVPARSAMPYAVAPSPMPAYGVSANYGVSTGYGVSTAYGYR